jgi:hypothetical protein
MQSTYISFAVNRHGPDAEFLTRANYAQRDLATVGD